jgi:hypothetical protein
MLIFSEFISGFNPYYSFSGKRRACRQRDARIKFINLEDLPAQSFGGAHRGTIA